MSQANNSSTNSATKKIKIPVEKVRNLTSRAEANNSCARYEVVIDSSQIYRFNTDENLRDYIGENERRRNQVHRAIEKTIKEDPDYFIQFNGGLSIVCTSAEVDKNGDSLTVEGSSLINGGQTQGEILRYIKQCKEEEIEPDVFPVSLEVLVAQEDRFPYIAMARNLSTAVKNISIAGKLNHLEDLEKAMLSANSEWQIAKSETDECPIHPVFLLQLCRLAMPSDLIGREDKPFDADILKAYKNSAMCLREFCEWHDGTSSDPRAKEKYDFTIAVAAIIYEEYLRWNSHPSWKGKNLQKVYKEDGVISGKRPGKKLSNGNWTDMASGILFPIIRSLHWFVKEDPVKGWIIDKLDAFDEDQHIEDAIQVLRNHDFDPNRMGRSSAAYTSLGSYPRAIVQILGSK